MPGVDDAEVLRSGDTAGGMSFTLSELTEIFGRYLRPVETRRVSATRDRAFGQDFLNCGLFTRGQVS